MPLSTARQEAAIRLTEAQGFLSKIKDAEAHGPQPVEFNIQKGLFLVLLYSCLEYSLTRAMTELATLVNELNVRHVHIGERLFPLALDPELTAIKDAGFANKWTKRFQLFTRQASSETVFINDGPFLEQLPNVWAKTIVESFRIFGVEHSAFYDPRVRQYIDELVERRNAISHGRESASVVGQSYTLNRLQNLMDEISTQIQYIFSIIETYFVDRSFIREEHKNKYY